jgi:hypothetical protein
MKCETVKIAFDNEQGFYICNADAIPKGAKIYKARSRKSKEEIKQDKADKTIKEANK